MFRPRAAAVLAAIALLAGATGAISLTTAAAAAQPPGQSRVVVQDRPGPVGTARRTGTFSREHMRVEVALTPSNRAGLTAELRSVYTPGSALFHHWLKRGAFDRMYAPAPVSVAAVSSYLHAQGLRTSRGGSPFLLAVKGSSGQIATAFGTSLATFKTSGGTRFWANTTAVTVPAPLGAMVQAVIGLDSLKHDPAGLTPDRAGRSPDYGGGPGGSGLTPSQLNSIYGGNGLGTSAAAKGTGTTTAVFELSNYNQKGITTFTRQFLGTGYTPPIRNVSVDGGPQSDYSGDIEVEADIEVVLGQVPDTSRLYVYDAPNSGLGWFDELAKIAGTDAADTVSISWAICELDAGASFSHAEAPYFEQMALQGQSVFASAGDSGGYSCERGSGNPALSADDPAAQPYVTAVGGTSLNKFDPGTTAKPAYPRAGVETVWNDGCTSTDPPACSAGAGGGGVSQYWAAPSWQTGPGVTSSYSQTGSYCGQASGVLCREVPDVSAVADQNTPYAVYCQGSPGTNSYCPSSGGWLGVGGTSLSSPLWSTVAARWDSVHHGGRFGDAAAWLYQLDVQHPDMFHDIGVTSGTEATNGFYPSTTGYDMATGLGTPDITNIVKDR